MLKMKGKRKKGFTLVELMVVIAIIAVLLLIAVPRLTEATKGSKIRVFEANFRTAVSSVNAAYADAGMDAAKVSVHPAVVDLLKSIHTKKPTADSKYVVDTASGLLKASITIDGKTYIANYNPTTSKVTLTVPTEFKSLATLVADDTTPAVAP